MVESNLTVEIPRKSSRRSIKRLLDQDQMDNQVIEDHSDHDQSRARWTTSSTKVFADLLVEQILQGNRPGNVFNKKAWKYVRDEFNKQTGLKFDRQQLKNHLDVLRKRYNHVKALLEQTGFNWDRIRCMFVAEDDVWQKCIEEHPEVETIRKKGCPILEQLCIIFSDSGADEKYALSSSGTAVHQMGQDQSRAKWTTALEKILADLMLEQVLQGNRSNNAFSKKAWKYIHNEFNKQTGLKFDKQQLKNRHGVLRRLYTSVKSLLDQNGFSWDGSQCMVIAQDELWAKYRVGHPDLEAIRVKGCPLYEQLHRIFSDTSSDGKYAFYEQHTTTPEMDSPLSHDQAKQDQSRAKWTPSLDKKFVDLLVEQTQQNCVSNKKAWKHIREQFNKQTGLQFDEQQLRNHQSVLRRWYNGINSLLGQSGFSWNESQHMVIADEGVWENHIKAHPEIETMRAKDCPIFKQLCTIFSEPGAEGRYVQSSHDIELDKEIVTTDTPEANSISAEPIADEASSHPAEEVNTSADRQNKRRIMTPISSGRHRIIGTETSDNIGDSIFEMASATKKRAAVLAHGGDQFSISSCIKVLNEMQGVEQNLYLAALDVLQDPDQRETFISMKRNIRLAWLKGKCNSLL